MRKFVTAGIAFLALTAATPSQAANYNWNGLYVGGNVGYSWGPWDNTGVIVSPTRAYAANVDGFIGGVQAGLNWQPDQARRWLLGIEGDFNWSSEKDSFTWAIPNFIGDGRGLTIAEEWRLKWLGTIRGRIGMLTAPDWLAYLTGGYAVGRVENTTTLTLGTFGQLSISESRTQSGWTIGGGVEKIVNKNWSAKLEYLYVDLGSNTSTTTLVTTTYRDHILRLGVNYKFN